MKKQLIPDKPVLEVKGWHCTDIQDMAESLRNPPTSFCIPFQFSIGAAGSDAADVFEIVVCSPDRIDSAVRAGPFVALPVLIPSAVTEFVTRLVAHANTTDDPVEYLVAKMVWEFDGYRA